ncbi:cupin domain-containing protein, partial [bacterium]
MQKSVNEHYEIWGADLEMPLIEDCGFNGWNIAEKLSWHSHEGFELIWLIDGQAAFEFTDGTRCELTSGEFFFKLPRQSHRAANGVTTPCKMCWIIFDPNVDNACRNTIFTPEDLDYLALRYREDERKVFTSPAPLRPLIENFAKAAINLHSQYLDGNTPLRENHSGLQGKSNAFSGAKAPQVALLRSYICQILLETAQQAMAG